MRHGVAGGDHRARVPRAHLGRRQKLFVGPQLFCAAAVEEPGRLVAARADGSLDRAQDGQRITLGTIEQVMARHRSEEHTSELQSLMRTSYAVCCLKKKTNNIK